MKLKLIIMGLTMLIMVTSCGEREEEQSEVKAAQLGVTCTSYPTLYKTYEDGSKKNMCQQPGKKFWGGLFYTVGSLAEIEWVKKCKDMNALDMGHKSDKGISCTSICEESTMCISLSSN